MLHFARYLLSPLIVPPSFPPFFHLSFTLSPSLTLSLSFSLPSLYSFPLFIVSQKSESLNQTDTLISTCYFRRLDRLKNEWITLAKIMDNRYICFSYMLLRDCYRHCIFLVIKAVVVKWQTSIMECNLFSMYYGLTFTNQRMIVSSNFKIVQWEVEHKLF